MLILGAVAAAQVAPPPAGLEIHGLVVEAGANTPVENAQVSVTPVGPNKEQVAKATTDSRGVFRIPVEKPGAYYVRTVKDGYTDDGKTTIRTLPSNQLQVTLDKDKPLADARLVLARTGELTGRVVDADTGKPMANFRVYPQGIEYVEGQIYHWGGPPAVTNSEGQFTVTGLRPGNYVAQIGPQTLARESFLDKFSEKDLEVVDQDYEESYWPGGGGEDMVLPAPLFAGGSASVGTVKARKVSYYRIHISLGGAGCLPGLEIGIHAGSNGSRVECGKDYLLKNYQPGSYLFYFTAVPKIGESNDDMARVVLPVEVIDKNLDLKVDFRRGADVDGRIVVADGASKPPLEKLRIRMMLTGDIQFAVEQKTVSPDSEGRFRLVNRPAARARITVLDLPPNFDVKEIRYNGSAISDNIVPINGYAMAHSVEIVVDDKPASITGAVVDGDKPVGQAHIVLVRWPVSREDVYLSAKNVDGDGEGRFQFAGLAPGEYRILAVAPENLGKLDQPRILERLLSGAERVTLTGGGSQNLTLKLTDPAR